MYREDDKEMEQLLKSVSKVDKNRQKSGRRFESHIWFDDGCRGKRVGIQWEQSVSSTFCCSLCQR